MTAADHGRLVRLKARRRFWLELHLWLGLFAGATLAVFGITGSILVFHQEIDEMLNPRLLRVDAAVTGYQPMENLIRAAKQAMPGASLAFLTYPRDETAALRLRLRQERNGKWETWEVAVNPYTSQVTGRRLLRRADNPFPLTLVGFVFELHYAFFLGEAWGYAITGALGALLIVSVLTGVIVWWPLTGRWRQALTVKRGASAERLNFDLHKSLGVYTAPVFIPVLFSGIYMNLPEHVVPVIELFSPVTYRYWFQSSPVGGAEPIGVPNALRIASARFPTGRPDWIYVPGGPAGTYTVCKHDVEESGSWITRRCLVMDQYTGRILDVDDPAHGTAGEVFTHWQWPLHSGQAFGMPGRILLFLSGLACPVLYVTGVIRWLQKRSARRRRAF